MKAFSSSIDSILKLARDEQQAGKLSINMTEYYDNEIRVETAGSIKAQHRMTMHEFFEVDRSQDSDSGHYYYTYRCKKCGHEVGRWEDSSTYGAPWSPWAEVKDEELYNVCVLANVSPPIPVEIFEFSKEVKKYFAKHPDRINTELSSRQFEMLVAEILMDLGFDAKLTKATRDGGCDIYAILRNEVTEFLLFVECKMWNINNHVGINVVQRLHGAAKAFGANKSMIVTTSFFTAPALHERKRIVSEMDLKDYDGLKMMLKQYR